MGKCIKDHPKEDVTEKIEDVTDFLEEDVTRGLLNGLEKNKWEQASLNELFHALKKLEKKITEEERMEAVQKIKSFLTV